MDPAQISSSEVFNPERWCYWGVCDWFPSLTEKLARLAIATALVVAAGIAGGRSARSNHLLAGVATSVFMVVLAVVTIWYMYPWATA
jgi:hypothetical protein